MAIDIGRCRWELHQRILFVAHPRQPGLFDAISALVEFERLDAVAGSPPHCEECGISEGVRQAKAALAEMVAGVLGEVTT